MALMGTKHIYLEETVPVLLCPPWTLHVLPDNHRFGAPYMRGQEVIACTMAWLPASSFCCALNVIFHGCVMPYHYGQSRC